jgi:hypothetical protein
MKEKVTNLNQDLTLEGTITLSSSKRPILPCQNIDPADINIKVTNMGDADAD